MYVGTDYNQIEPGESDVFSMEFTEALGVGVTIVTATWACFVGQIIPGAEVDDSPGTVILGPAGIITAGNRTFTSQTVGGMVDGNNYILQATVVTSDGRTLQNYSHVLCRKPR